MLAVERKNRVLEELQTHKRVLVSDLSSRFHVSEETIRRDLEKLEAEGFAKRSYGGAVLREDASPRELPYTLRKRTNVEGKQHIAALVAGLINDGDFIMLDESSTSLYVARAIRQKQGITLVTNSIEIILETSGYTGWTILSTGGVLKKDALALAGHQALSTIKSYHVDKAVISCTGLDLQAGYSDAGEDNTLIKRAMMDCAHSTILAADSRKFDKQAFAHIGNLDELFALVTDKKPSEQWQQVLADLKVELIYE